MSIAALLINKADLRNRLMLDTMMVFLLYRCGLSACREAAGAFMRAMCIRLQVVGAAHTRKLFEKSLIQNLQS
jgi:hypothetical protein